MRPERVQEPVSVRAGVGEDSERGYVHVVEIIGGRCQSHAQHDQGYACFPRSLEVTWRGSKRFNRVGHKRPWQERHQEWRLGRPRGVKSVDRDTRRPSQRSRIDDI